MGNNYSLKKVSKYLDENDKNTLHNHSLVFNSVIFDNKLKPRYFYFRFELKLDLGVIMVDRFIAPDNEEEWMHDKSGILQLLKLYNGIYRYNNLFDIKFLNEAFYKFIHLFVKDKLFIKLLLGCKKMTYKQYINNLKNEEGESIENYQRRTLKEILGENY